MATAVDTITSYSKKDVTTRYGQKTVTAFHTVAGKEYSTFKGEIASQAVLLMNQPVEIEYETQQKGEYTNNYLLGVKTVGGATPVPQADPGPTPEPVTSPYQAHKDEAIARAVALKAAVDTLPSLGEPTKDPASVIALAEFYLTWLKGE